MICGPDSVDNELRSDQLSAGREYKSELGS